VSFVVINEGHKGRGLKLVCEAKKGQFVADYGPLRRMTADEYYALPDDQFPRRFGYQIGQTVYVPACDSAAAITGAAALVNCAEKKADAVCKLAASGNVR
jgi:hypothetical protein